MNLLATLHNQLPGAHKTLDNGIPAYITVPASTSANDVPEVPMTTRLRKNERPKTAAIDLLATEDRRATAASYSLIDLERDNHGLRPLKRSEKLHELACEHAVRMAIKQEAFHSVSTMEELHELLDCPSDIGHSVVAGYCVIEMHTSTMKRMSDASRLKYFSPNYREYGVAAARAFKGSNKLFVCQFFRS